MLPLPTVIPPCKADIFRPEPGLEIHVLPDDRFKRVHLHLNLDRPLDDGLSPARTLLLRLLEAGTAHHPDLMSLVRAEEELWGAAVSLGADRFGDHHRTALQATWIADSYLPEGGGAMAGALQLAQDRLLAPLRAIDGAPFCPDSLERERHILIRKIRGLPDDRGSWARERFLHHLCAGEPNQLPPWGTEEQIQTLTAEDLERARLELLDHASILAVVVGPVDPEAIQKNLASWFPVSASRDSAPLSSWRAAEQFSEVRETLPMDQARALLGYRFEPPTDPSSFEALVLANLMLGGGVQGRLFRILREERSLCYGISSALRLQKGILAIHAGIDGSAWEEVRDEVKKQVAALAAGEFSSQEMERSLILAKDDLATVGDSCGGLASYLTREAVRGFHRTPQERIDALDAVTPQAVATAASSWQPSLGYLLSS